MKVLTHRIILLGSIGLLVMAAGTACTLTGANAAPLTPSGSGDFLTEATPTEDLGFLPSPAIENTADVFGNLTATTTSDPFAIPSDTQGITGLETPTPEVGAPVIPQDNTTPGLVATPFAPVATVTPLNVVPTIAATSAPVSSVSSTCPTTYTVQSGDTLFRIALQFGLTYQELASANGITNPDAISIGTVLTVPCSGTVSSTSGGAQPSTSGGDILHTVQPGENLFRIALKYGLQWEQVAAYNGITDPNDISVGQVIHIPQG